MKLPHRSYNDDGGFALLSAVTALAILLILASSVVATSQSRLARAYSEIERSKADAFSDAVLISTVLALETSSFNNRPRVDGMQSRINVLGMPIAVAVEDEFGKIDLNAAPPSLLSGLFQVAGLNAVQGDELAEQVELWRDGNDAKQTAAPFGFMNSDRRQFQMTDELLLVPGIDPKLFSTIEPSLTVFSGQVHIDRTVAGYQALMADLGVGVAQARRMIEDRSTDLSPVESSSIRAGKVLPGVDQRGWPFRLRSVFLTGTKNFCLDTEFRLTGASGHGFVIMRRNFTEDSCG